MWDPYKCFEYYGRSHKKTYSSSGELVEKDWVYKPALMPAWVVLGHEIGHYWHYVNTAWFVKCLKSDDIAGIERQNFKDHEAPMLEAPAFRFDTSTRNSRGTRRTP